MSSIEHVSLKDISLEEVVKRVQEAQMNILKKTIESQAAIEMQMIAMMAEVQPHIGSNINITA